MSARRFRLSVGLPALIALVVAGSVMYRLTAREELWGSWPLPFLLGLWGLVVAFRQNVLRLDLLGLATASGLALGLGFTTWPTWPLQGLGFAGLLYLTDVLVRRGHGLRQQWWYGYHALVIYNITATWWVANTALAAGVVANFLNALLMVVPWALTFLVRGRMPKVYLASAIALWIGFEYLHYNWQIAWPWLALGNSLGSTPGLAQWYEITGVFGGSLYLTVAGALTYRIAAARRLRQSTRPRMLLAAAWVVVPMLGSIGFAWHHASELAGFDSRATRTITAIQPNLEPHYEKFAVDEGEQLERFYRLIAAAPPSDLYALPETSFSGVDEASAGRASFARRWGAFRQNEAPGAGLLVGLSSYRRFGGPTQDPALRTQSDGRGGSVYFTAYNAALAITPDGEASQIYHKSKLVPGVEFLPYRKALFFFEPLVDALGGTTSGLGVSESPVVFNYGPTPASRVSLRLAPLVCYESIYGDYVRDFVRGGANLLTVITNDGWWDDSPGYRQHLQFAQLRAIENRRYLVQAANSGTSAFVNSAGEVYAATGYAEAAALTEEVRLLDSEFDTFYTRFGDYIGRVAAGASCLLLLSLLATIARGAHPPHR